MLNLDESRERLDPIAVGRRVEVVSAHVWQTCVRYESPLCVSTCRRVFSSIDFVPSHVGRANSIEGTRKSLPFVAHPLRFVETATMKISLTPLYDSKVDEIVIDKPHFVIGRAAGCDFIIDNPLISRRHCVITVENQVVSLRDLESTNGTYVNGRRLLGRRVVLHRDLLHLEALGFRIHMQRSSRLASHLLEHLQERVAAMGVCTFAQCEARS